MELNVTTHSIGIDTKGGRFVSLIPRGTPVPVRHTEVFTTGDDNQTSILITVYAGEDDATSGNEHVGTYRVHLAGGDPRGMPKIEVTFAVDLVQQFDLTAFDLDRDSSILVTRD